jgi:hypothetical protein
MRLSVECGTGQALPDAGEKRGRNLFPGSSSPAACFFGQPRGRSVYASPNRRAVRCVQAAEPYGSSRATERRSAASSASVGAALT